MEKVNILELSTLINDVKTSVDRSSFGPLFITPDPTNVLDKQVNQLAWSLFLHVLTPTLKAYMREELAD